MNFLDFFGVLFILYVIFLVIRGIFRFFVDSVHYVRMRKMDKWWEAKSIEERRKLLHDLDDYREERHDFDQVFHPTGDGLEHHVITGVRKTAARYEPILPRDDIE